MNYGGPDRQENRQKLLDAVDSVRETIITGAEQAEAEMTIPPASINALYDSGLFSLKLPEVLGGAEADPITQMEVLEALALYDSSASWCVMIGATSIGSPGAFLPDEGIQEVFRDGRIPRAAGVGAPTGQVTPVEGGYRVTGRWPFASGIRHSEWVGGGITIPNDDAAPEIRRALFPTSEVKIHDNWDVMGLRGTGSCDFSVSDVLFGRDQISRQGTQSICNSEPPFIPVQSRRVRPAPAGGPFSDDRDTGGVVGHSLPGPKSRHPAADGDAKLRHLCHRSRVGRGDPCIPSRWRRSLGEFSRPSTMPQGHERRCSALHGQQLVLRGPRQICPGPVRCKRHAVTTTDHDT